MHKRLVSAYRDFLPEDQNWLNLDDLVDVELTSEESLHPIESALLGGDGLGWRAGKAGKQSIRICFIEPRNINKIRLVFEEFNLGRTQEYVLRWSQGIGQPFIEIVRQQWNFNPRGATIEIETHDVDLPAVKVLELTIDPDIQNPAAVATLKRFQIA